MVAATVLCSCAPALAAQVTLVRTPDGGIQPQAVTDSRHDVHLIYYRGDPAGGDIYYTRRNPGQTTFAHGLKVNRHPGSAIAIGTIRGAQIAVGRNDRVHVCWNGRAPAAGSYLEAPMWYTRLNDAGSGFEPERNVITSARGLDGGGSVAADQQGNVYVMWHAPIPGNTNGEAGRAVFVARSTNDGQTFGAETRAFPDPTGACACCGMKAFADQKGNVLALYRSAANPQNRNEVLLLSRNRGAAFRKIYEHDWKISTCPMSSAFIAESPIGILAAAETHGRVFFVRVNPAKAQVSEPTSPEGQGKYPVVIANAAGEILLVWTTGTSWSKGGEVRWQLYNRDREPLTEFGHAADVPAWSMATGFVDSQGNFVIVY